MLRRTGGWIFCLKKYKKTDWLLFSNICVHNIHKIRSSFFNHKLQTTIFTYRTRWSHSEKFWKWKCDSCAQLLYIINLQTEQKRYSQMDLHACLICFWFQQGFRTFHCMGVSASSRICIHAVVLHLPVREKKHKILFKIFSTLEKRTYELWFIVLKNFELWSYKLYITVRGVSY